MANGEDKRSQFYTRVKSLNISGLPDEKTFYDNLNDSETRKKFYSRLTESGVTGIGSFNEFSNGLGYGLKKKEISGAPSPVSDQVQVPEALESQLPSKELDDDEPSPFEINYLQQTKSQVEDFEESSADLAPYQEMLERRKQEVSNVRNKNLEQASKKPKDFEDDDKNELRKSELIQSGLTEKEAESVVSSATNKAIDVQSNELFEKAFSDVPEKKIGKFLNLDEFKSQLKSKGVNIDDYSDRVLNKSLAKISGIVNKRDVSNLKKETYKEIGARTKKRIEEDKNIQSLDLSPEEESNIVKQSVGRFMNVEGMQFLSPSDKQIASLNEQYTNLATQENLSIADMDKMDQLRSEIQSLKSNPKELYDPVTGKFIAREEATPEALEFNDRINTKAEEFAKNDLESLIKLREQTYFDMLNSMKKFEKYKDIEPENVDIKEIVSSLPSAAMYDPIEEKMEKYMAVNKALMLNEDPAGIERGTMNTLSLAGESIGESLLGINTFSNQDFVDKYVEALSEEGLPVSKEQKERYKKTIGEDIALSTGPMLRIMGEIALSAGGVGIGSKAAKLEKYGTKINNAFKKTFGDKSGEFMYKMLEGTAKSGVTFGLTEEGVATGVGEGMAQGFLNGIGIENLLSKSKLGKILTPIIRTGVGATSETIQEFTGEYIKALSETDFDWKQAAKDAFGETPDEFRHKLAVIGIMSAGMSGTYNLASAINVKPELDKLAEEGDPVAQQAKEVVDKRLQEEGIIDESGVYDQDKAKSVLEKSEAGKVKTDEGVKAAKVTEEIINEEAQEEVSEPIKPEEDAAKEVQPITEQETEPIKEEGVKPEEVKEDITEKEPVLEKPVEVEKPKKVESKKPEKPKVKPIEIKKELESQEKMTPEEISSRISKGSEKGTMQHYQKLLDSDKVSSKTKAVLSNKDGSYEKVSDEVLNEVANDILRETGIDEKGLDEVYKVAEEFENPAYRAGLRTVMLSKVAYNYELQGLSEKAAKADLLRSRILSEAGQEVTRGRENATPEQRVYNIIRRNSEQNKQILEQKPEGSSKTVGQQIDQSVSDVNKISQDTINEILSENKALKKKLEKFSTKAKPKMGTGGKVSKTKEQIAKAKERQRKAIDKIKKGGPLTAGGLNPEAIEGISELALGLVEEGYFRLKDITERVTSSLKDAGVNLSDADIKKAVEESKSVASAIKESVKGMDPKDLAEKGITSSDVDEVIKKHWSEVDLAGRDLAQKLVEDAGLDEKTATEVAKLVQSEFSKKVKSKQLDTLQKALKPKKETKKQERERLTNEEKILEAINMGVLTNQDLTEALSEKYGLKVIPRVVQEAMTEYANAVQTLPYGELRTRKIKEYNDLLDSLDPKTNTWKTAAEFALEAFYTSILSAPTTTARAFVGATLTTGASLTKAFVSNPIAFFPAMKEFMRGAETGRKTIRQIIKDGHSELDYFDRKPGKTGVLDRLVNKSLKEIKTEDKSAMKMALRAWMYLPVKMYRGLIATDSIYKYGMKEFESYIEAYNNELLEGDSSTSKYRRFEKNFYNKVNKRLGLDEANKEAAKIQVETEIEKIKEMGESIPRGYEQRRYQEVIDEKRDDDLNQRATNKAFQSLLMNEPVGTMGSVYRFMSSIGTIKEEDSKLKMLAKLAYRGVFPFMRVPANFLNMAVDFTPLGVIKATKHAFAGTRDAKGEKVKPTTDDVLRVVAATAMGNTLFTALMMEMFDWDEEKGTLVPDKNSIIDVTFVGTNDYIKNKSINEDYQDVSFRLKYPKDAPDWIKGVFGESSGGYTNYIQYRDNPIVFAMSTLGAMSDDAKFKDPKKVDGAASQTGYAAQAYLRSLMSGSFQQTYAQGAKKIIDMTTSFKTGDYEKAAKISGELVVNPTKAVMWPSIYSWFYKQQKALSDTPERQVDDWMDRIAKDVPLVDQLIENERTDQFGYEIVRDFEVPLIPEAILKGAEEIVGKRKKDYKEWQLVYKYDSVTLKRNYRVKDREYGFKKPTDEQKIAVENRVKQLFREYVNRNYKSLDSLDAPTLQDKLNLLRSISIKKAKDEILTRSNN
jgi:hypothetical protein